jgi:hypothetical protein
MKTASMKNRKAKMKHGAASEAGIKISSESEMAKIMK